MLFIGEIEEKEEKGERVGEKEAVTSLVSAVFILNDTAINSQNRRVKAG
jgi:hypothetical protein